MKKLYGEKIFEEKIPEETEEKPLILTNEIEDEKKDKDKKINQTLSPAVRKIVTENKINIQSVNLSNLGSEPVSLIPVIHSSISLDSVWNITFPSEIDVNSSFVFDSSGPNISNGYTAIWFESSSIGLEIHLASMCYSGFECSIGD